MNIKQTIEHAMYSYDPTEFMPVRYEGELVNKGEFVAYKAGKVAEALGHAAYATAQTVVTVGKVIVEHIGEEV